MPAGRPTTYKKQYCKMLVDHMSKGLSFLSFAAEIKKPRAVLYEWLKKHKEFAEAKQEAEEASRLFWEKMGIGIAAGKLKNGNAAIWIYNMKCRFPAVWRPKRELDISARYEQDLKALEGMSASDLAQIASEAAKYLKEKEGDEN